MLDILLQLAEQEGRRRFYCALTQGKVLVLSVNESLSPICMSCSVGAIKPLVDDGRVLLDLRLLGATRYPPDTSVNYKQYVMLEIPPTVPTKTGGAPRGRTLDPETVIAINNSHLGRQVTTMKDQNQVDAEDHIHDAAVSKAYDVFISYNSRDGDIVEDIARRLEDEVGLTIWKDNWELAGGDDWFDRLPEAISYSRAMVVFIGPRGLGPWHKEEIKIGIQKGVGRGSIRVIPVALPGCPEELSLPEYLDTKSLVNLRTFDEWGMHLLQCAIIGTRPGRRDRFKRCPNTRGRDK